MKSIIVLPKKESTKSINLMPYPTRKKISTILFATDLSEASKEALKFAKQFAKSCSASLKIVYAWQNEFHGKDSYSQQEISNQRTLAINELKIMSGKEEFVAFDYLIGRPEIEYVEQSAFFDLLIVQLGHTAGLRDNLFHSETFKIIENSRCPVLVLPNKFYSAPLKKITVVSKAFVSSDIINNLTYSFSYNLDLCYEVVKILSSSSIYSVDCDKILLNEIQLERNIKKRNAGIRLKINSVVGNNFISGIKNYLNCKPAEMLVIQMEDLPTDDFHSLRSRLKELFSVVNIPTLLWRK
mgnify:CR=1 FL=1